MEELEQRVENGDANINTRLGLRYEIGREIIQDFEAAEALTQRGADDGYAPAMSNLGSLYEHGRGVETHSEEAREWYEKGAAQIHAGAKCSLGFLTRTGQCVLKDPGKATEYYKRAAAQDRTRAPRSRSVPCMPTAKVSIRTLRLRRKAIAGLPRKAMRKAGCLG